MNVETVFLKSEDLAAQAIVSGDADIGVGTPYGLIQRVNAPIRMFYQLSMLRFWRDGAERQLSALNAAIKTLQEQMERDAQASG